MSCRTRLNIKCAVTAHLLAVLVMTTSPVAALTLEQVVTAVSANHPALEAAQWQAKSVKSMKGAKAWLPDPKVELMFEKVPTATPGLKNADMTNYTISQEVPFPAKLITKAGSIEKEYQSKRNMAEGTKREVIFAAKKTYYEIVANQNVRAAKSSILKYYAQIIGSMDKNYQTGTKMPTSGSGMAPEKPPVALTGLDDILMTKMKKEEIEIELLDLDHKIESLQVNLNLMMGRPANLKMDRLSVPAIKTLRVDEKQLEEKLLQRNSDILALNNMVEKAKKDTSLAKMSYAPNFMTAFTYNQRQNMDNAYSLSFGMNVPIWINKNQSLIAAAKADQFRANAERDNQILNSKQALHYLMHYGQQHQKILSKYRGSILPLAKSAADIALTSYQGNLTSATSALQKLISYQEVTSMYWMMWADYQMQFAMLEQLIGEEL